MPTAAIPSQRSQSKTPRPTGQPPKTAATTEDKEAQQQARAARLADLKARCDAAVLDLASEAGWRRMLAASARTGLRRYSWQNRILLHLQCPEASSVAGFHDWRKLGRKVTRGQKALWILAPVTVKLKEPDDVQAHDEPSQRRLVAFKAVPVFDISQTEPLPGHEDAFADAARAAATINGPAPAALWEHLNAYVQRMGFQLERGDCGTAGGWTDFTSRTVRISGSAVDAHAARVLAHEAAHIACDHGDIDDYRRHRGLRETEADSVAYLVCADYGLDTLAEVVPYVAGWAGRSPEEVAASLKQAASTVDAAALSILSPTEAPAALTA